MMVKADSSLHITTKIGGKLTTIDSLTSLDVCDWNYVALSYDGNKLVLYINGVAAGESVVGVTRVTGGGDWRFGGRCSRGSDGNFRGVVDEVALFSRALTAEEVATQYGDPAAASRVVDVVEVWSFGSDKSAEGLTRMKVSDAAMEVSVQRPEEGEASTV